MSRQKLPANSFHSLTASTTSSHSSMVPRVMCGVWCCAAAGGEVDAKAYANQRLRHACCVCPALNLPAQRHEVQTNLAAKCPQPANVWCCPTNPTQPPRATHKAAATLPSQTNWQRAVMVMHTGKKNRRVPTTSTTQTSHSARRRVWPGPNRPARASGIQGGTSTLPSSLAVLLQRRPHVAALQATHPHFHTVTHWPARALHLPPTIGRAKLSPHAPASPHPPTPHYCARDVRTLGCIMPQRPAAAMRRIQVQECTALVGATGLPIKGFQHYGVAGIPCHHTAQHT